MSDACFALNTEVAPGEPSIYFPPFMCYVVALIAKNTYQKTGPIKKIFFSDKVLWIQKYIHASSSLLWYVIL